MDGNTHFQSLTLFQQQICVAVQRNGNVGLKAIKYGEKPFFDRVKSVIDKHFICDLFRPRELLPTTKQFTYNNAQVDWYT